MKNWLRSRKCDRPSRRRQSNRQGRLGHVEILEQRWLLATVVPFDISSYDPDPAVMDSNLGITGYTIESFEDPELTPGLSVFLIGTDFNYEKGPIGPVTVLPESMRRDLFDTWDGTWYMTNRTPEGNRYRTIFQLPENTVSFGVGMGLINRYTSDFRVWANGQVIVESVKDLPQYVNVPETERNIYLRIDARSGETLVSIEVQQSAGIQMLTENNSFDHLALLTMPTVSLSVDNLTLPEASGVATFTAVLSHPFDRDVTVDLGVAGTASSEDYALSSSQIVIPAGVTSGAVTVEAVDDGFDESDETIVLEIIGVSNGSEEGIQQQTTTIVDDDAPPTVSLSVDRATVPENGGIATFTATLSTLSSLPVIVDLGINGTAATSDYAVSNTRIIVAPGVISGNVTISTIDDATDEPDELILVDIVAVANGTESGTQRVMTTILDDDAPATVTLAVDNDSIAEDGGTASVTATLSAASGHLVTVDLAFGGTAEGADFTASAAQIEILAGATSGSITVTATDDELDELHETVVVEIVAVTNAVESEMQQRTITILDDDDPPPLQVSALTATASGFLAEFSTQLDEGELNLYDRQTAGLGPADVVLHGTTSGPVAGSLVVDPSRQKVTFIKTGGPLVADTYTVTLRSAADGFKGDSGQLLDGNGDGTGGDAFSGIFTVGAPAPSAITIGLPDFVRGPGQDINLPADATTGIPLTISEGTNVRAIDLRISYDPAMLEITAATVAAGMPAGATVVVNTTTPGLLILLFFSATSLPAGSSTFVNLQAAVPTDDPSAIYRTQQRLDIHAVTISDGDDNEFPTIVDDALHLAIYFGDVSGNGRINASDAAQVARFAALIDLGFGGSPLADPILVGDISGNGRINAADASRVAQFAALIPVPEIPPIPGGIVITGAGRFEERTILPQTRMAPIAPASPLDNYCPCQNAVLGGPKSSRLENADRVPCRNVDALMSRSAGPELGGDQEKLPLDLEEAVEQLLSASNARRVRAL